jgi:hypothetical protein
VFVSKNKKDSNVCALHFKHRLLLYWLWHGMLLGSPRAVRASVSAHISSSPVTARRTHDDSRSHKAQGSCTSQFLFSTEEKKYCAVPTKSKSKRCEKLTSLFPWNSLQFWMQPV